MSHKARVKPLAPTDQIVKERENGGASRDRTDDLLRARQALSQLSYGPDIGGSGWT